MTDFNTAEMVELDPGTVDTIADAVVTKMRGPDPYTTPRRSQLEEGGVKAKPGERMVISGGHDKYTMIGRDDAERVSNLWLVKTILSSEDPSTWSGEPRISPRLDQVMLGAAERYMAADPTIGYDADPDGFISKSFHALRADARVKAMTSTGANAGDEWVPTLSAADLWRDVHLETVVAARIRRVDMPSNPYHSPIVTADPTFYLAGTENTAVTASNASTDKAVLTASKIQAEVDFSGELTEDSIIPMVPSLRSVLVRRAAQTIDDITVSGDTTTGGTGNINSDDQARTANSADLALAGMRRFALITNTAQAKDFAGAPTTTLFLNTRAKLGRYGARASDLLCIMAPETETSFLDVSGFKTVSDFGPNATVLTGQLGSIFGTPVLAYEAIPGLTTGKTAADGKADSATPANNTKGFIVLVHRNEWTVGYRRGIQVESFRDIQKDQNILVCSFRMALIPSGHSTLHTAIGYNITVL